MRIFVALTFIVVLAALALLKIDAKWLTYIHIAAAAALFLGYLGYVWSRDDDQE